MDMLSTKNKVYKVETVKEVYMAACGLPAPNRDHTNQIAHFALDIKEYLIDRPEKLAVNNKPDSKCATLKIGIHCGTVIAGVIGKLCPRYRLFGDTVNVAARMETNSEKGKIQITKKFNSRIDNKIFQTKSRGKISIKGKDFMSTYFLIGRRHPGPADLTGMFDDFSTIRSRASSNTRLSTILPHRPTIFDFCLQQNSYIDISQSEPATSETRP